MREKVEGLTYRQKEHLSEQLEMDKDVETYYVHKTGDNEYEVIIYKFSE